MNGSRRTITALGLMLAAAFSLWALRPTQSPPTPVAGEPLRPAVAPPAVPALPAEPGVVLPDAPLQADQPAEEDYYYGYYWRDLAAGRVAAYPGAAAALGAASLYPRRPEDLLLAHIDAARDGDARARFQVARALNECRTAGGSAALDYFEHSNAVPEHAMRALREQVEYCQALRAIAAQDLGPEAHFRRWLEQAAAAGDVQALAWMVEVDGGELDGTEAKRRILDALADDPGEALFTLHHVMTYLAQHVDDYATGYSAWDFALCQLAAGACTVNAARAIIKYQDGPAALEEIEAGAAPIVAAVNGRDWAAIARLIPDAQ